MKASDFQANVVLASGSSTGGPDLITVHCRYPRMIHAEVMTHRVFSRNARSSRAVPTKKLLSEEIYVPHFMKNQAGMQSFEEFSAEEQEEIQNKWIEFAQQTQEFQRWLSDKKVHKQWANRPGEWFGYIDTLITSTKWENWFDLRNHPDAMPEIRNLAQAMDAEFSRVLQKAEIQALYPGQWHIPYVSKDELEQLYYNPEMALKLSVARCARISYAPFDGNTSIEKELQRYEALKNANPAHASPFEHQAKVAKEYDPYIFYESNFQYPWLQYRKIIGE